MTTVPAVVWGDEARVARRQQHQAEKYAEVLTYSGLRGPFKPYSEELRNARRAAALAEADAWASYALRCEEAFASAAEAEMAAGA